MGLYDEINNFLDGETTVEIPSIDFSLELLMNVRDKQDKEAFETILHLYMFAKKPETEEQLLSISIVCEAYRIGSIIFK